MSTHADAAILEHAARIITERSTRPNAIATRVLVRVLTRQAELIRRETGGSQ